MALSLDQKPETAEYKAHDMRLPPVMPPKHNHPSAFTSAALYCSAITIGIGFFGLIAWAIPALSTQPHPRWFPILIYPEAAFSFFLLGTALYAYARTGGTSNTQGLIRTIGAVTVLMTLLDVQAWSVKRSPWVERYFLEYLQNVHIVYQPSFWIAASLLSLSTCLFFLPSAGSQRYHRAADFTGYTASLVVLTNVTILLSYFYGTPVFHDTIWILPCLTSTAASVSMGIGLIALLGPRQFPLRPLMGPSVRARLLRTFLPVAAAAVLIHTLLQNTAFSPLNPVISITLTAFLSMSIAGFLVIRSSNVVSRQIEQAVRESEERFGILVDSLEDYAIFMLDPDGHVVTWNSGAERLFGYRAENILGENFDYFYTADEKKSGRPSESLKQSLQLGSYLGQGWRLREDGTRFWADVTLTPLRDETQGLRGYATVTRNITERRKAEEALRQKTAFVHMLQMVSSAANESSSIEHAMQICLDQVCQQTGWPLGHSLLVSSDQDSLQSVNWYIETEGPYYLMLSEEGQRSFKSGEGLPGRVLASGTSAWISDVTTDSNFPRWRTAEKIGLRGGYAFPVKVGNEVVAVLEFFSESVADPNPPLLEVMEHIGTQLGRVVERTRAEAALRESEMRFRSVAQSANDAIVSCNSDGRIIAWNKGARVIFGFGEEDILGQALSRIVPEGMPLLSADAEFGRTLEVLGMNKAGEAFPIELSVADWKVGEDVFFTVIIRNIERRKEAEAQIHASLQEKEVLLKEIHHRVKNNLQIICSLLRLQSQHLVDKDMLDMFKESQNRVQSMALIHEYLYQSHDMAHIKFSEYIRNLTSHLFRSYGATPDKVSLGLHIDESPLNLDTAIPCGLIVTELVSNALKYAFPDGRKGSIQVEFRALENGARFELGVHDNGAGIPQDLNVEQATSLGLRLVHTLTRQLGGRIRIENNQGTHIVIAFTNS